MDQNIYDVLVIGSGAAGLSFALHAHSNAKVAVLSKGSLGESCTLYAQGGIAGVMDPSDSIDLHVEDTLNAGAGLCHRAVVHAISEKSKSSIQWLIEQGVVFTEAQSDTGFHLTREGGHQRRRVVHAADATGRAIESTLLEQAGKRANIHLMHDHIAVDLITTKKIGLDGNQCIGAYVLDRQKDAVKAIRARSVVLATGGASKAYLYTSNPDGSSGDGIAMAWRAGCRVANMEFIQFHPTCLYHPKAKTFLMTEALRGEGAKLQLADGTRFMHKFDERGELAPRDIVARAIDYEMKRLGAACVYLDISHRDTDFIQQHFPTVYSKCLAFGIDITREPIPVVPAAHYTCGGIVTDLQGKTDIANLYSVGESAFTGLHGANRLASNSLLECIVCATEAARDFNLRLAKIAAPPALPPWDESRVTDSDERVVVSHNWDELRRFMWDYVGIVRSNKRLRRAKSRVDLLLREIDEYYGHFRVSNDLIELRNLAVVADLIIRCAQARKESRGLHYTLDFPATHDDKQALDTYLTPPNFHTNRPQWEQ